jgi:lipopolysaccharide transport system ATP-binding protein
MAIQIREAALAPLHQFIVSAPGGAIIGVIGEDGSGVSEVLRLATGSAVPYEGTVHYSEPARYLGPLDALNFSPAAALAIDHTLSLHDSLVRARSAQVLERLRRDGATVLIASHDLEMLKELCEEIWWLKDGQLAARGDPGEVIDAWRSHVAASFRSLGNNATSPVLPSMRRGDGRAQILDLGVLGEAGQPASVIRSGETMRVQVTVYFAEATSDPVVGVMIRTRIGFEVFGTNTELEKLKLGPCMKGVTLRVTFSIPCNLCPQEYTITAASHDPDGVWHDWMEDAVAFSVADNRYTAGVANLRAEVVVEVLPAR